jgi:hypothetical protein
MSALALQSSRQRANLATAISDHTPQTIVFVAGGFDRYRDFSRFVRASSAYKHIEYVCPHAKDCFSPAGASFALHHSPPFAL